MHLVRFRPCSKMMLVKFYFHDAFYIFFLTWNTIASEGMNLITIVLRSSEEPILSRIQMHRLARAQKAHTIYMRNKATLVDSDDDEGPQDEDAWLLEDLKVLTNLYSRLRDREQLIELIFEVSCNVYGLCWSFVYISCRVLPQSC
jgi:Domain of unknown function in PX-proteins (DUF3818)